MSQQSSLARRYDNTPTDISTDQLEDEPRAERDVTRVFHRVVNWSSSESVTSHEWGMNWLTSSREWASDLMWERTFLLESIQEAVDTSDWGLVRRRILEFPAVLDPIKLFTPPETSQFDRTLHSCPNGLWKEIRRPEIPMFHGTQTAWSSSTLDENAVYEPTILGALCATRRTSDHRTVVRIEDGNVGTHRCTLVDVIHTVLMLRPELARCSQRVPGHVPLRDAVLNDKSSDEVVEWLVQADPSSVHVPDRYGCTPLDHFVHAAHSGRLRDLVRLQSLLRYAQKEIGRSKSPLLSLLSMGAYDSPWVKEEQSSQSDRHVQVLGCARLLLEWNPRLVTHHSRVSGCSPLHVAVRNYGSYVPLLRELLQRDTDKLLLCHRNYSGDLVLHVACAVGVPLETLELILTKTVDSGPSSIPHPLVWSENGSGYTPIDLVWIRHVDARIGTRTAQPTDKDEICRVDALRSVMLQQAVEQALESWPEGFKEDNVVSLRSFALDGLGQLMRRIRLIVSAAARNDVTRSNSPLNASMLHQVATLCGPNGPVLPGPLLDLFTALCSNQIDQVDPSGKLPLHYAVELRRGTKETTKKSMEDWKVWILKLLRKYPDACRVRDQRGRLPLHHALSFDHTDASSLRVQEARNVVIQVMVDAFPLSVELVDTDTGLSPFQLAATNPLISIETLYHLLRMSPSAIVP